MKRFISPMSFLLYLSVLTLLGFCGLRSQMTAVATFNKDEILSSFVSQLGRHTLTDEALAQKTKRFHKALSLSLKEYAKHHHAVIFDVKTVSASDNDVTKDILMCVAKHMRDDS